MNHLFVTQDFAPDLGGMARRHVETCRRIARFADETMVVSTVAAPNASDEGEAYRVRREGFPFTTANRFLHQVQWGAHLRSPTKSADIVHCGNIRPCGYAVWYAARRARRPYLVYVNGGDVLREKRKVERPLKRWSARRILGDAAGIVANSRWTADVTRDVMEASGIDVAPPVAVIDLGTDPHTFTPENDRRRVRTRLGLSDEQVLLTVARLVPHKGQDAVIAALALLAPEFPRLRYVLVGEGHDESRLRSLAAEKGVSDRVIFAGVLSDAEIADAYATATLYVGLSRLDRGVNVEGFGISFIEAGASGVPSVAGDSGGVRSAVRDGLTGLVVPPEDPLAIAKALRTLLRDDDLRIAMGKEARRLVETHYNWDRVGRETLDFAYDAVTRFRATRT